MKIFLFALLGFAPLVCGADQMDDFLADYRASKGVIPAERVLAMDVASLKLGMTEEAVYAALEQGGWLGERGSWQREYDESVARRSFNTSGAYRSASSMSGSWVKGDQIVTPFFYKDADGSIRLWSVQYEWEIPRNQFIREDWKTKLISKYGPGHEETEQKIVWTARGAPLNLKRYCGGGYYRMSDVMSLEGCRYLSKEANWEEFRKRAEGPELTAQLSQGIDIRMSHPYVMNVQLERAEQADKEAARLERERKAQSLGDADF